jgi:hypothetical protein
MEHRCMGTNSCGLWKEIALTTEARTANKSIAASGAETAQRQQQ